MNYLVICYEDGYGAIIDDSKNRCFENKASAEIYAKSLNDELANGEEWEDPDEVQEMVGTCYRVGTIEKGE